MHLTALGPRPTSYRIGGLIPGSTYIIGIVEKRKLGLGPINCIELGGQPGAVGFPCPGIAPSKPLQRVRQGNLTVRVTPASVVEGAQFTVSGTIKDANGGLQEGATVKISAFVSGSTLPLTTVTTDQNGSFSTILNAPPITGSVEITATVQGAPSPPVQGKATITVTGSQ